MHNQNVLKQSKGLNGDLKPEHMKTTNKTSEIPTTDIGSQSPTIEEEGAVI